MKNKSLFSLGLSLLILSNFFLTPLAQAASNTIIIPVPFTSQAPLGQWSDQRQEDGCEEASVAMAMAWVKGQDYSKTWWRNRIVGLSDWELRNYGEYRDVTLTDVIKWLFKGYYNYDKVTLKAVTSADDIVKELAAGHVVLTPMAGQALHNPYFTSPGPLTHMLLIKGYDYNTQEFIVNDPGTRRGESYRYKASVIFGAIKVYPTGHYEPIKKVIKQMLVVSK